MKKYLFLLMLLSLFICKTATADFYKWVDENGNTQISDTPPPDNKSTKDVEIHKGPSPEELANMQNEKDATQDKSKKDPAVMLFTKNDCKDCDKARDYLQSKKVSFTEYNMDNDKSAAERRKKYDEGDDVPFAVVYNSIVFGFTENVYEKVLKKKP